MMLFSGIRTVVSNVLNVKNLNAFMYTLCLYALPLVSGYIRGMNELVHLNVAGSN